MNCKNCGAPMNEGEKFCTNCGAQNADTGSAAQSPYGLPSNTQQPYAQQPYGQPYGQPPYGGQPYGQQPYGQPPKKSKKGLLISIAAIIVVLGMAAVAMFVWPGFLAGANTVQMKFMSDNAQVFEDAFADLSGGADEDITEKPFDMTMSMTMDIPGVMNQKVDMDMAYDEEALGLRADAGIVNANLLLLDDVLYIQTSGQTMGISLKSDKDLSKPMTLKDRLTAIVEGLQEDTQQATTALDYEKLAMMLVNSIDESNFKQSGSKTTLTLDADALIDTMKTFRDKLAADKELTSDLEAFINGMGGQKVDVIEELDKAIGQMEKTKDDAEFELTWVVNYSGGKPVSIDLTIDSQGETIEATFGYKNTSKGKDVSLEIDIPDESAITADFEYEKTDTTFDFTLDMTADGENIKMQGSEEKSGDDVEGNITINISGQDITLSYEGTLNIGMPSEKVKDDSRFEVDIDNAQIQDLSEFFGTMMLGSMMPGMSGYDSSLIPGGYDLPGTSSGYGFVDLEGVWEAQGTSSGGMYTEGPAILFKDGYAYGGINGMSEDDILNDTAGVRGTKDGAMYFLMGNTLTIYNNDGSTIDLYWDGANLWASDGTEFVPRADATVQTY